jgi:membrane associated rhomboid family serine protease
MAIGTRSWARSYVFSGGLPPGIKMLLLVNVGIFLLRFFLGRTSLGELFTYFALIPTEVVTHLFVWQLATYMFLHSGIAHILWNMLALWMFGTELERLWGTRRFLQFYFFCGIGAGLCVIVGNYLFGNPNVATVGSSGAIYGLLLASAVLWPDRQILFSFLIPIKMKYFVIIIGAIAFLNSFNPASPVSDVAHLGGMLFGYVFLKIPGQALPGSRRRRPRVSITGSLRNTYRNWKLARAKRKFEVYMRKQKSDRDRRVN